MTSVLCAAVLALGAASAAEGGRAVPFHAYSAYFEKNSSGLSGKASYLALTSREAFDRVFGPAATMQAKEFLPADAFERRLVVAVIKRGGEVWTYDLKEVTSEGGTLTVRYEARAKPGGGARYASPLIVAADRGDYNTVVFVENGKRVGQACVPR